MPRKGAAAQAPLTEHYTSTALTLIAETVDKEVAELAPHVPALDFAAGAYLGMIHTRHRHERELSNLEEVKAGLARALRGMGVASPDAALDGPDDYNLRVLVLGGFEEGEARAGTVLIARMLAAYEAHRPPPRAEAEEDPTAGARLAHFGRFAGHSADPALDFWIDQLARLYQEITGRKAAVTRTQTTGTGGAFVRFCQAATAPIAARLRQETPPIELNRLGASAPFPTGDAIDKALRRLARDKRR